MLHIKVLTANCPYWYKRNCSSGRLGYLIPNERRRTSQPWMKTLPFYLCEAFEFPKSRASKRQFRFSHLTSTRFRVFLLFPFENVVDFVRQCFVSSVSFGLYYWWMQTGLCPWLWHSSTVSWPLRTGQTDRPKVGKKKPREINIYSV